MSDPTRVLIIDDDELVLELVKTTLESSGYEVIVAVDGESGLEKAKGENINLILLDLVMPGGLDGYGVYDKLKADDKTKDIPVIMLTAKTQKEDIERGEKMGVDAYITKPFEPEELESKIIWVLNRQ